MGETQTGMQALWTRISELGLEYGGRLLGVPAIFVIGKWLARLAARGAERAFARARIEPTLATFLKSGAS